MNDLEPWKIWAVTGALVAAILGSAAIRVRPTDIAEASAQASTLTPDQSAAGPAVGANLSADQFDAYSLGNSHRSFSRDWHSNPQPSPDAPQQFIAYRSASRFAAIGNGYQEPEMDVAQQIIGTDGPEDRLLASDNREQSTSKMGDWLTSATFNPAGSELADGSYHGWFAPSTAAEPIDLAWQDADLTDVSSDTTGIFVPFTHMADSNVSVINIRPAFFPSEDSSAGGGYTNLLRVLNEQGSQLSSQFPPVIEDRDDLYVVDDPSTVTELQTQAVYAARVEMQQQALAAQQAQAAYQQAAAVYVKNLSQAYVEMVQTPQPW